MRISDWSSDVCSSDLKDLIDRKLPVSRIITARDLQGEEFAGQEYSDARARAIFSASNTGQWDMPIAIELPGLGNGSRLGAGVRVTSGAAAGRQLYCTASEGDILFCAGRADAKHVRFGCWKPGDMVPVDTHAFLPFVYYYLS